MSKRILLTLCIVLASTGIAQAKAHHHHIRASITFNHPKARTTSKVSPILAGVGNVGSIGPNGCENPPVSASFIRVIVGYNRPTDYQLPCAQAAHSHGHPVLLVIQWNNTWNQAHILQRFTEAVNDFQAIQPFAVAIGNEQELEVTGGGKTSPQGYSHIWKTVEPMVVQHFPHAIRVAGEISPWGNRFMTQAAAAGLPGAQAYADHVYPDSQQVSLAQTQRLDQAFASLAHRHHAQAWADEGLCGPDAWDRYGCTPARQLSRDGFSLAAEWWVSPSAPSNAPPNPLPPVSYY